MILPSIGILVMAIFSFERQFFLRQENVRDLRFVVYLSRIVHFSCLALRASQRKLAWQAFGGQHLNFVSAFRAGHVGAGSVVFPEVRHDWPFSQL